MLAHGVGDSALWCRMAQRQFGAEDGLQLDLRVARPHEVCGFGEPRGPVEPVVIGDRERGETETDRLSEQIFWWRGDVEERDRRMRMQHGVGNRVFRRLWRGRRLSPALMADRTGVGSAHLGL